MPLVWNSAAERQAEIRDRLGVLDGLYAGQRMPEERRREWDRLNGELCGLGGAMVRRGARPITACEGFSDGSQFGGGADVGTIAEINGDYELSCAITYTDVRAYANLRDYPVFDDATVTFTDATATTPVTWFGTFTTTTPIPTPTPIQYLAQTTQYWAQTAGAARRAARGLEVTAEAAQRVGDAWGQWVTRRTELCDRPQWQAYEEPLSSRAYARASIAEPLQREVDEVTRQHREEQVRLHREQVERERREQAEAQRRAEALLLANLTEEQAREWRAFRYFHVEVDGGRRRYRIRHGLAGNVDVVHDANVPPHVAHIEGGVLRRYCCHVAVNCPTEDNVLTQKLWLETREQEFLAMANPY